MISVLLEHTKLIYIASIVKKVVPTALDLIIVSYARQVSLTKMEHVSVHTINIYMMENAVFIPSSMTTQSKRKSGNHNFDMY